jgi:CRP-like cAMP-binding protein
MPMQEFLERCRAFPAMELAPGEVMLREGERTGRLFVLAEGCLEVFRGEVQVALVDEPGAVFGEMALLLDGVHTTSVRAVGPARVHVVADAEAYLAGNADLVLPIARLLARRLRNVTTYLVDVKRQYGDREDHLGMVDEVLEALAHEQGGSFIPEAELPREPSRGASRAGPPRARRAGSPPRPRA